ncbi:MAG: HAMP domain-containing sensor histidine kinase [Planctomycetota bacterium]
MAEGDGSGRFRFPAFLRREAPKRETRSPTSFDSDWGSVGANWIPVWTPEWLTKISLADKCLVLFGGAVVLIVVVALSLPWFRMNALVGGAERRLTRELAAATVVEAGSIGRTLSVAEAEAAGQDDRFVRRAIDRFRRDETRVFLDQSSWVGFSRQYRTAMAVRDESGALSSIVLLDRTSGAPLRLLAINTLLLAIAAIIVLGLALFVFYLITHRVILGPVRALKATSQQVRAGNHATRSEIRTGDEFEELAGAFNLMLGELQSTQNRLRQAMAAQDARLSELSESNEALYQAAKVKGEFLASVSHELRTPLNSIIGFAELLLEIAQRDGVSIESAGEDDPEHEARTTEHRRRTRYLENLDSAARQLSELIESLLEMAKIEAGKAEVRVERVALGPFCEALVGMIHPLAHRKGVSVTLDVADDLPMITTDGKKLRQVVFNFLSNAVKFIEPRERTGRPGLVVLRAERLAPADEDEAERVRISVIDTGPGIARDEQSRIFEKFTQADGGHTRSQEGAGLGLSIAKELASLIGAEIQLESDVGRGSMFSVVAPVEFEPDDAKVNELENAFRGALAGRRGWAPGEAPDGG